MSKSTTCGCRPDRQQVCIHLTPKSRRQRSHQRATTTLLDWSDIFDGSSAKQIGMRQPFMSAIHLPVSAGLTSKQFASAVCIREADANCLLDMPALTGRWIADIKGCRIPICIALELSAICDQLRKLAAALLCEVSTNCLPCLACTRRWCLPTNAAAFLSALEPSRFCKQLRKFAATLATVWRMQSVCLSGRGHSQVVFADKDSGRCLPTKQSKQEGEANAFLFALHLRRQSILRLMEQACGCSSARV